MSETDHMNHDSDSNIVRKGPVFVVGSNIFDIHRRLCMRREVCQLITLVVLIYLRFGSGNRIGCYSE